MKHSRPRLNSSREQGLQWGGQSGAYHYRHTRKIPAREIQKWDIISIFQDNNTRQHLLSALLPAEQVTQPLVGDTCHFCHRLSDLVHKSHLPCSLQTNFLPYPPQRQASWTVVEKGDYPGHDHLESTGRRPGSAQGSSSSTNTAYRQRHGSGASTDTRSLEQQPRSSSPCLGTVTASARLLPRIRMIQSARVGLQVRVLSTTACRGTAVKLLRQGLEVFSGWRHMQNA
jgi:hypothetical protein